ncbi:MAG: hypothetical protein ACLGH3_08620 [Actinomycetota bacterium]
MPVLVLGADSPLGRELCLGLLAAGGQVRAYCQYEPEGLRSLGVFVALGGPVDVPRLEAALTGVHTLIHLTGRDVRRHSEEEEALEVTSISAHAAEIPRVVVAIAEDAPARTRRAVDAGLVHTEGCDFETIVVAYTADAAVATILAADSRA